MAESIRPAVAVTKMAYLLFSQAPCDNTSSAKQKAIDQEQLFNQYYWQQSYQHRCAQMPPSSA